MWKVELATTSMQLRALDELTPSMEVDRTLLHMAAFGGTFPSRSIELWRRRSKMLVEYVGLFAVERGHVVGQTFVLRIPYTFRDGPEVVSGLAGVTTRPDRARGGIARALLAEVHRREKEAGIRFITLWTNRSWGAHGLYEQLGYRDLYSSPWAVHAGTRPRRKGRSIPLVGRAHRGDLAEIEGLHAELARGRLGFCQRPPAFLRTAALAGELHPDKELLVARAGGKLVGYAHLEQNPYRTVCGELVAASRAAKGALVSEVGRVANGTPFAFQHTPVTDDPRRFAGPGYSTSTRGWWGLMGCDLGRTWSSRDAIRQFATDDRRFLCLAGDRF